MKNYSKSEVMKRAWEIYKAHGGRERVFSFSRALKQSWYIAKRDARLDSMEKPAKVEKLTGSAKQISWAEDIKARIHVAVENSVIAWERKAYEAFLDIVESVEYAGDIIDFWGNYRGTLDDADLICMMCERRHQLSEKETDSKRELSERMNSILAGCTVYRDSLKSAANWLFSINLCEEDFRYAEDKSAPTYYAYISCNSTVAWDIRHKNEIRERKERMARK